MSFLKCLFGDNTESIAEIEILQIPVKKKVVQHPRVGNVLELRLRNVHACFNWLNRELTTDNEVLYQITERGALSSLSIELPYRVDKFVQDNVFSTFMQISTEADLEFFLQRNIVEKGSIEDLTFIDRFEDERVWNSLPWRGRGFYFFHFKETLLESALSVLDLDHRVVALYKVLNQTTYDYLSSLPKDKLKGLKAPSCFDRMTWEKSVQAVLDT